VQKDYRFLLQYRLCLENHHGLIGDMIGPLICIFLVGPVLINKFKKQYFCQLLPMSYLTDQRRLLFW